jgi:glucan 1,3-beta-glucosidase
LHSAAATVTEPRRLLALLLPALALAALLGWAGLRGQPVALPEVAGARLPCVSYAPFHRPGQSPFDPALVVPRAQIEADLRRLRELTGCVRTYGLDHGLDQVPAVARALGMRVLLGAWIGRDSVANDAQLQRALALAHEYRDTIDLLIVGNEVLLRRELSPEQLAALLARARRDSPVPVAYADVWEFWLRHRALLQPQVDVVAAHVLPYWEDEPVGVAQAVGHVHAIAAQLRTAFGTTPVYIAETGWPAAGRQRGPARPGGLEQARFVRELLARQAVEPLDFNLIEAYDQPWKRALEGAMGGHWGLFDADGGARVPLAGAVAADPQWRRLPLAAALGALLGAVLVLPAVVRGRAGAPTVSGDRSSAPRRGLGLQGAALLVGASAGGLIGALALLQWEALHLWSRNEMEFARSALTAGIAGLCSAAAAGRLAMSEPSAAGRPGAIEAWRARAAWAERLLATARLAWLFIAAMLALGLVFDARYRPLDWSLLAGPALLLAALALRGDRLRGDAREERILAAVCAICAPLIVLQEGWVNPEALLTAAALAALGASVLLPHRAAAAGRASTSAPSSAAGAASAAE